MMDPPKVLLEQSFLVALTDARHPDHERCAAIYRDLVEQYRREEVLLVAVSDHLDEFRGFAHRGLLAPLDRLWVGFQHRRAARRMAGTDAWPPAVELTLVMCERHRVQTMVTLDPAFEPYDIELLPAG
jgi:LmbE family N-acetylglucosaminyl deacetylase